MLYTQTDSSKCSFQSLLESPKSIFETLSVRFEMTREAFFTPFLRVDP